MRINLLALYNLYLLVMFAVGTALRYRLYLQVIGLILSLPQRWPRLGQLVMQERWILINWQTLLPTALTLLFTLLHSLVLYVLFPHATLTPHDLAEHLGFASLLALLATTMLILDASALYLGRGEINAVEVKKQLDQAEFWLSSRWADVVSLVTFKKIRPRQMVHEKLRSALQAIAQTVNWAMWYWAAQLLARFVVALVLWFTWFFLRS